MKKDSVLKMMATMAMSMATIPFSQAATITIPDGNINPGGYYKAAVSINPNGEQMFLYKGFQFDLIMTESISVDYAATTALPGFIVEGNPYGSLANRLVVYTEGNAVDVTDNILTIAFKAADNAAAGPNIINIENVVFSSPEGWDIVLDESRFTITVVVEPGPGPEPPGPEIPEKPYVPATPIPDGMYGNANGTYISAIKIRQGNELFMGINEPVGGYPDDWDFAWYDQSDNEIGYDREIVTTAELYGAAANAGKVQATSENVYTVDVTNYDPEGGVFWNNMFNTATVTVYKRPQIPTQLLRKGQHPTGGQTPETGTSYTFVVMMTPLDNQEILDLGLSYTYGYTDAAGEMHVLETSPRRYSHTTGDIYWNTTYTFWAYSQWTYPDGSVVTSGLRYLDGSEDADFDASVFTGVSRSEMPAGTTGIGTVDADSDEAPVYYTLSGVRVVNPGHGIFIRVANGKAVKVAL